MNKGDLVAVHPHGLPGSRALGVILMLSGNGLSILVAFDHLPPFCTVSKGWAIHPEHGVVLAASRVRSAGGAPIGPWVEIMHGGHFEIEPAAAV